jgi:hypothetical protein
VLAPEVVHERAQGVSEREHSASLILGGAGFEARFARLPIDVSPLKRQDFRLDTPSRHIPEAHDLVDGVVGLDVLDGVVERFWR